MKEVERGAALLDSTYPGWEYVVDLPLLDIASGQFCILGQLYGRFCDGCTRLKLDDGDCEACGFLAPAQSMSPTGFLASIKSFFAKKRSLVEQSVSQSKKLTRQWKKLIKKRWENLEKKEKSLEGKRVFCPVPVHESGMP